MSGTRKEAYEALLDAEGRLEDVADLLRRIGSLEALELAGIVEELIDAVLLRCNAQLAGAA